MEKMTRTNMHYPKQILDRLRAASKTQGLPMVEIVRRAVEKYLDAFEKASAKNGDK